MDIQLVDQLINLLTNSAQLIDGFKQFETEPGAWTEWDESVRKEISEVLVRLYALKTADYYCPSCNFYCTVAGIPSETIECEKCRSIMLRKANADVTRLSR